MKFVYLNLMTIFILVMSIQASRPDTNFFYSTDDTLKAMPIWEIDQVRTSNIKSDNKILSTPFHFVSKQEIKCDKVEHIGSKYYLPIYKLQQEKEYFLLI